MAVTALCSIVALLLIFDVGEVIDLPSWANVGGIDIPLIGDTDVLDCRLRADDQGGVVIALVDGDSTTYAEFAYVWRNGQLVDGGLIGRPASDTFTAPGEPGEQFYAISKAPEPDDRTFCESIVLR